MTDAIQVIDEDGDVVLVVGPEKKKMKVSSALLSKASPVFKALFGPHFREGQATRTCTEPIEISLPEDDCWALLWICSSLHFKSIAHELGSAFGSGRLLSNAVVIDKYDLTGTIWLQMQALLLRWVLDSGRNCTINDASDVMAAAYLLDQSRAFQMITELYYDRKFSKPS